MTPHELHGVSTAPATVWAKCVENPPVIVGFPWKRASHTDRVSMSWSHRIHHFTILLREQLPSVLNCKMVGWLKLKWCTKEITLHWIEMEFGYISIFQWLKINDGFEYGKHHNIPLNMRLCHTCCMIDDEMYFITNCKINQVERDVLYSNIMQVDQSFMDFHTTDKCVYLFSSRNPPILTWLGKLTQVLVSTQRVTMWISINATIV